MVTYCQKCKTMKSDGEFSVIFKNFNNTCNSCEFQQLEKNRKYQRDRFTKFKKELFRLMGGKCVCCGVSEWWNLVIDHKKPVKRGKNGRLMSSILIKKLIKYPKYRNEFQLLCWGCNMNKMTSDRCRIDHSEKD